MSQTPETVTKSVTIQGLQFDIVQPYAAGHTITEAEAAALNQTRNEAVRNNMARVIKKETEELAEGADIPADLMKSIAKAVAAYDAEYEFTLASVGGGRKSTDPVDVEANRLARAAITAKLKADGRKVSDIDKDALASAIAQVAAKDSIRKAAEKAVKERTNAAENALADLDL